MNLAMVTLAFGCGMLIVVEPPGKLVTVPYCEGVVIVKGGGVVTSGGGTVYSSFSLAVRENCSPKMRWGAVARL
jgi:hypothetical protein